jgi:hypothetical protein
MVIQDIVVEPCVADSETGKLPGVTVRISTALDRCRDKSMLEEFLVEEA